MTDIVALLAVMIREIDGLTGRDHRSKKAILSGRLPGE